MYTGFFSVSDHTPQPQPQRRRQRQRHTTNQTTTPTNQLAAQFASTREKSPGTDTTRIGRLAALSSFSAWWCMSVICLVNSVHERDLSLLNSVKHDSHLIPLQRDSVSNARKLDAITGHFFQNDRPSQSLIVPIDRSCPAAPEVIRTNFRIVHRTPAESA